jgi:hypothetical protein
MGRCNRLTATGKRCRKPATGGSCGAKHPPAAVAKAARLGRRVGESGARAVGRQGAGVAGATTVGLGKAGMDTVLHPDPLHVDQQVSRNVKAGARTGRRTVRRRRT